MIIPTINLGAEIVGKALQSFKNEHKNNLRKHFQNTNATIRETYNFGYDYFSLANGNETFTEIPPYLTALCQKTIEGFGSSYDLGKVEDYLNIIISIYYKGHQLEAHTDVDSMYRTTSGKYVNFCFGENVLGVVLQADNTGKFYVIKSNNEEKPLFNPKRATMINEQAGTAFLLTGPLRHKPYYHGVSCVENLRVSVTFRTIQFFK